MHEVSSTTLQQKLSKHKIPESQADWNGASQNVPANGESAKVFKIQDLKFPEDRKPDLKKRDICSTFLSTF